MDTTLSRATYQYLTHVPAAYDPAGTDRWPLVVFLHGAGEKGDDIKLVKKHGIPKLAAAGKEFPFIAISPQCPRDQRWNPEHVEELIRATEAEYRVDPDRIYLTGMSMGGMGTWATAIAYPDRFGAIAPICARGNAEEAARITHVPAWVFHGAKDTIVPEENGRTMVEALRAAGGIVGYTIYPEADHDSWTVTYEDERLYEWLLSNKRGEPPVAPPNGASEPE